MSVRPESEEVGRPVWLAAAFTPGPELNMERSAPERNSTDWEEVGREAFLFLSVQHAFRILQPKTRAELGGPFFGDYVRSVEGIHGWGDGDGIITNYLMHPGMGSVASFIYLQNSSQQRTMEFDPGSGAYWRGRLKAMGFAALYSTQFEIGLFSEATIGNVGMNKGTSGYTDFVMTPVGGFAINVAEDAVDKAYIRKLESHTTSVARRRLYRVALNPTRSIANLLRFKAPWYRDARPLTSHSLGD